MTDHSEIPAPRSIASLRKPIGTRVGLCEKHGEFEQAGCMFGARELWSGCPACSEEQRDEEQRRREDAAALRVARAREQAIGQAAIPPRFRERSFENFVADTPEKRHALAKVRDFVETWPQQCERGGGLILSGVPGTGKTHLAAAAMLALLEPRRWVQYITCMGMIRAVRETWRRDSERTEAKVLGELGGSIDLLVIDEVGVQYGTDGEQQILFEVLDRRYSDMRPSILITNQDKDGFRSFVGDRVFDRLRQTHSWIPFDWPSYRITARKEAA